MTEAEGEALIRIARLVVDADWASSEQDFKAAVASAVEGRMFRDRRGAGRYADHLGSNENQVSKAVAEAAWNEVERATRTAYGERADTTQVKENVPKRGGRGK